MDIPQRNRRLIQAALAYLALTTGFVSIWILIAPRSFYDDFPTGPAEWVSALPFELLPKGAPSSPLHGDWVSGNLWDVRDVFAGQDVAVAHSDYAPKRVTVNTRPPIEVILSRR